jgi:DNA-binding protein HU-beta
LTKNELVSRIAAFLGVSKVVARRLLDELVNTAIRETKKNGVFVLPGLGRMVKALSKARMGRNPQTGGVIKIPAKTVVKFCVAKTAKDAVAGSGSSRKASGLTEEKIRSLTKTKLVRHMAEKHELNNKQAAAFLKSLADVAIKETKKEGVFVLPGLGRLVKSNRKVRMGRNPQTGGVIKIPAKTVVKFRVAKTAKDAVAGSGSSRKASGLTEERVRPPARKTRSNRAAGPGKKNKVSVTVNLPAEPPASDLKGLAQTDEQNHQPQQLFPEISCKPRHVVQKNKFTTIVRVLREKPPTEQTKGDFWLPPGPSDQVHTVAVHLLMRGESKQGEMKCSAAAGTVKEAVFKLKAPEMDTDVNGNWKASMFEQIRVNFYLKGRWCGEAQTNIEILRDKRAKHCDRFPDVEEPLWRQHLHIEPGAEPPDLLVRIQKEGSDSFRWTLMSPHMNFKATDQDCVQTLEKPERYVEDNFEWLAGKSPEGINRVNVKGSCERLYRATPKAFQDAYWRLFRAVKAQSEGPAEATEKPIKFKTIQFVSDEPCVPWEIMQVVDRDIEPDVGPVILSEKYQVGRWLSLSSCILRSKIEVHKFVVSTSTYSGIPGVQPLPWTQGERDYLSAEPWKAELLKLLLEDVQEFLRKGSAQAIHFACHGAMDQAQPQRSKILLEDDLVNFRTTAVDQDDVRRGIGMHHPLVFLNACQLGAGGKVLSLGSGWPQAFLEVGASAFIGPLWSVQDESARDAATLFYGELSAGKSLGEALQTMRRKWLDGGSVTFLAYTLYGDPTAKVVRM